MTKKTKNQTPYSLTLKFSENSTHGKPDFNTLVPYLENENKEPIKEDCFNARMEDEGNVGFPDEETNN